MARFSRIGVIVLGIVALLVVGVLFTRTSPADAATIDKLYVTCSQVIVAGKTEVIAPFVKVQVALASDLTSIIAQKVVSTRPRFGADYRAVLDLSPSHLPDGTLLVISVGEWNGVRYLKPARITSRYCSGGNPLPTPVPTSTLPGGTPLPTPISGTPLPTPVPTSVSGTPPPTPTQVR
jgi:hypothetical protein